MNKSSPEKKKKGLLGRNNSTNKIFLLGEGSDSEKASRLQDTQQGALVAGCLCPVQQPGLPREEAVALTVGAGAAQSLTVLRLPPQVPRRRL